MIYETQFHIGRSKMSQEPNSDVQTDEWLERHIARLFPRAHQECLDAYIGGSGIGGSDCEPQTVRENLRKHLRERLAANRPPSLDQTMKSLLRGRESQVGSEYKPDQAYEDFHGSAIAQWNDAWTKLTDFGETLGPSLAGWNFQLVDLHGINLANADLRSTHDNFYEGNHRGANFEGASLARANLSHNNFQKANMRGADLHEASLVQAGLENVDLSYANLEQTDLRGANLRGANLTGANLRGADLRDAELHRAVLDMADVAFARGLLVNENSVFRTKFTNRAGIFWTLFLATARVVNAVGVRLGFARVGDMIESYEIEDSWSSLRRTYTGPNFFITLLLTFIFLVPYAGRAFLLKTIGQFEERLLQKIESQSDVFFQEAKLTDEELAVVRSRIPSHYSAIHLALTDSSRAAKEMSSHLQGMSDDPADAVRSEIERLHEEIRRNLAIVEREGSALRLNLLMSMLGTVESRRFSVWQLLLGMDSGQYGWPVLVVLLFIFNGLRWILTVTVAPMRDSEERSFITPAKPEYRFLLPVHRVVRILFWISLVVGIYTFFGWMTSPVYVFW